MSETLATAFDDQQAAVLAQAFSEVCREVFAASSVDELKLVLRDLVEIHQRNEQRLIRLTELQQRVDQRISEVIELQKQTMYEMQVVTRSLNEIRRDFNEMRRNPGTAHRDRDDINR